jgi:hypothetical protein
MAIGTQIGFAIGGFGPTAAAAIEGDGPNGWVPVAVYVLVSSLIAAAAVATTKETFKVPLADLGRRLPLPRPAAAVAAPPRERTGAGVG